MRTKAYHPQTDGLVERFNRTLIDMLICYFVYESEYWERFLPYVGETGPILDSRGFYLISPGPPRQKCFFTKVIRYPCPHQLDFFQRCYFKIVEVTRFLFFGFFFYRAVLELDRGLYQVRRGPKRGGGNFLKLFLKSFMIFLVVTKN
jgi:hypothetical protein